MVRRNQIFAIAKDGRKRIKIDPSRAKNIPAGYGLISKFPGYDGGRQTRKSRLLLDADAGTLRDAFQTAVSEIWAVDAGLERLSDTEIVRWAKRNKRIVVTFNDKDYWPERSGFKTSECGGLLCLKLSNNGTNVAIAARLIDNLLFQMCSKLPAKWWLGTKVRISNGSYTIKHWQGGQLVRYSVREGSNSALWFKLTS